MGKIYEKKWLLGYWTSCKEVQWSLRDGEKWVEPYDCPSFFALKEFPDNMHREESSRWSPRVEKKNLRFQNS